MWHVDCLPVCLSVCLAFLSDTRHGDGILFSEFIIFFCVFFFTTPPPPPNPPPPALQRSNQISEFDEFNSIKKEERKNDGMNEPSAEM